ncbi:hypothetical protein, partial [Corynebacterium sp. HMSC076C10]|uniref:hypothetical protein n=1 Tax=Corynebacterium sp. HMSC076C10 TaxID=1739361 RepID=UPI001AF005ED
MSINPDTLCPLKPQDTGMPAFRYRADQPLFNPVHLWVKQKWAAAPNATRELATTTHNNKLFMPAATYS